MSTREERIRVYQEMVDKGLITVAEFEQGWFLRRIGEQEEEPPDGGS